MEIKITNEMDRPAGTKRMVLITTPAQRKRGIGMMYAILSPEFYALAESENWKLIYRWGPPENPKFAAECKHGRKRISLHRFVLGLHGEKGSGLYVIPKDGDALHCWPENLEVLTKDQLRERRAEKVKERGSLTDPQQVWLDAECKRTGKSRWQVIGSLIDEKLGIGPEPIESSEFD